MTQFSVLAKYLSSQQSLSIDPPFLSLGDATEFSISNGFKKASLQFIDAAYIHYICEHGTPNEIFRIVETPGHAPAFQSTKSPSSPQMSIDQFGDRIIQSLAHASVRDASAQQLRAHLRPQLKGKEGSLDWEWHMEESSEDGVRISSNNYSYTLPWSAISGYEAHSKPGESYAFLDLTVQLHVSGNNIKSEPFAGRASVQ